jgi:hypothetical protein
VWFIRTVPDRLLRADPRRAAQRTLLEPTMSDEYVASARDLSRNQRHLQSRHQHASFRSRLRSFPVPRIPSDCFAVAKTATTALGFAAGCQLKSMINLVGKQQSDWNDMSDFIAHFTKVYGGRSAYDNMLGILSCFMRR